MIKIKVLLFGIATDLVGESALEIELPNHSTVGSFTLQFQKTYPTLTKLSSYAIAVNESYAADTTKLRQNDVVAIIPPVSGG